MKIAFCLSGEPRFVEECYPQIEKNILNVNKNIDVFIHTWYSEDFVDRKLYSNEISSFGESKIKKDIIETVKNLYSPKSIQVDKPMNFESGINWGDSMDKYYGGWVNSGLSRDHFRSIKINNMYSFLYSNMRSILLKKEFELKNGFTYDCVVRFRFDNIVNTPIEFDKFDMDYLHYQDLGQPDRMVSDWINFSNSENMDAYSSLFNNMEKISKICLNNYGAFSPESLIRGICDIFNIKTMGSQFGLRLPVHGKI